MVTATKAVYLLPNTFFMKKAFYWVSSALFLLIFYIVLLLFHPIQWFGKSLGYLPHKRVVDVMLWCINKSLLLTGSILHYSTRTSTVLPHDRPLLIVSNHQSMFDIPAIGWKLRSHHPKYVAKKSLEYGIPSISYNIRHGGSVAIDRGDARQAMKALEAFGQYVSERNFAACIFPEGTRSKDGHLREFKSLGLLKLLQSMPNALVVPVVVQNFWKLERYRLKPVPFGVPLRCTLLEPIERDLSDREIVSLVEERIREAVETWN